MTQREQLLIATVNRQHDMHALLMDIIQDNVNNFTREDQYRLAELKRLNRLNQDSLTKFYNRDNIKMEAYEMSCAVN